VRTGRERSVSLILGSDPTIDRDGVGQYTEQLYKHISAVVEEDRVRDLNVDLVLLRPGSLQEWRSNFTKIFERSDLVHIEYPYEGWGTSPVPGLYPGYLRHIPPHRTAKVVTTFHEWRSMHPLRKASILPLALSSSGILFVSDHEHTTFRNSLCYRLRITKPITRVIPIGVNLTIPELRVKETLDVRKRLLDWKGDKADVLLGYFGFIYDSKQPIKMLRTLKSLLDLGVKARLVIAGDFPADHVAEKKRFMQNIRSLGLEHCVLFLGFVEDATTLARTLSACNAVLLLFSDGVSARRSSFWTILELGIPLVTTRPSFEGEFDNLLPRRFHSDLRLVDPTEEAESLAATVAQFKEFRLPQQRRDISPGWRAIADEHIAFYRKILQDS
jgi:glycosyltransferase involved in cell wall biosynthesis